MKTLITILLLATITFGYADNCPHGLYDENGVEINDCTLH